MGSLLLFGVLATLMIATRRIDWANVTPRMRAKEWARKSNGSGCVERGGGPSYGRVALDAHGIEPGSRGTNDRLPRQLRPAGFERRRRRVLDGELHGLGAGRGPRSRP